MAQATIWATMAVLYLLRKLLFEDYLKTDKTRYLHTGLAVGAMLEECVFRWLLPEYIGVWLAGMLFVAVHYPKSVSYLIYLIFFTCMITAVYLHFGLVAAIIVHLFANLFALYANKLA